MKTNIHVAVFAAAILGASLTGCGKSGTVEGSTYEGNGGVAKIEFQSGGKAFVWTGPVSNECSYAQDGKTVSVTCQGDKTDFTVNDDGSLAGPPDGFLARLTKKQS